VVGPVGYLRTVDGARPDLTFVQLPLLWAEWYVRQLHRTHPELKIDFDRLDGAGGTLRALVEANGTDRFGLVGPPIDDSLSSGYRLYPRGLVQELRPSELTADSDAIATQNDAALRAYRIPNAATLPARPWDRLVLSDYAYVAFDVGRLYDHAKQLRQARQWYQRALAIDPDLSEARSALAALPP
jgi:tetratricopeptide (TPR) repeat protein